MSLPILPLSILQRIASDLPAIGLIACFIPVAAAFDDGWDPPEPNPADPVNYIEWINAQLGAGVEDNAADRYLSAYRRLTPFEGDWGETLRRPWSDDENEAVAKWLQENRAALLIFKIGTRKRDCFIPLGALESVNLSSQARAAAGSRMEHALVDVMLPYLKPHRDTVKGLIAEGFRDWNTGRTRRLPGSCLAALSSAHHLGDRCPFLIQRLVAIACARIAHAALLNSLALSDKPGALAARTLPKLEKADPPFPPFEQLIRVERLTTLDLLQRLFRPGPRGAPWILDGSGLPSGDDTGEGDSESAAFAAAFYQKIGTLGYDRTRRDVDTAYDTIEAWCVADYHEAFSSAASIERTMQEHANPLVVMFVPALTAARATDELGRAARRATHLVFHLFAQRAKVGQFPDSLDELDTPDLNQLRLDPFSGKDLIYKKTADGFTLYTVAGNQKDDGGHHNPKWRDDGDYVFWPVQSSK